MTSYTHDIENSALPMPIAQMARRTAQQLASSMPTPQIAQRVCLNTLAVYVVNAYLQTIGIATDLDASDCWNPVVRLCADVADLEIAGVGRLECRPLRMHEQSCYIPPEVWSDRIGYVIVQIDESLQEANILGFTQTVATDELPIRELRPIEDLIDRLHQLMQPVVARVNLSQWLNNIFETGWQTVESVLNPAEPSLAFSFRNADTLVPTDIEQPDIGIRRAKFIDLGMQLAGQSVALIVEIRPESEKRTNILLQVHPTGSQIYLPPQLQLIVLDESGTTFLEAIARSADNYIQLEFSGEPGERFSVKVALGDVNIIEDFAI